MSKATVTNVVQEYFDETLDDTIAELNTNKYNNSAKNATILQNEITEILNNAKIYRDKYNSIQSKNKNKEWFTDNTIPKFYKSFILTLEKNEKENIKKSIIGEILRNKKDN